MSQSVGVQIVVLGMASLIDAVVECGLQYVESRQSLTCDDGVKHQVDLVVHDEHGATVGVTIDPKTKEAKFVAKDTRGAKGKALAGRIAQRYAMSRAIDELKKKGYQLVKEEKLPDGTTRATRERLAEVLNGRAAAELW